MTDQTKDLRALAEAVTGWSNVNAAWRHPYPDYADIAILGAINEDGVQSEVAEINADTYGFEGESMKLALFYAAANPTAVLALLDRIAELEAQLEAIGAGGVEPLRKPRQDREESP